MADLILGPVLRYVAETVATVWVETDAPCRVEILGHETETFQVEGHHYALLPITDLDPGNEYEYEVTLDGKKRWPQEPGLGPSVIRTLAPDDPLRIAFGSCRLAVPHEPPYTLSRDDDDRGREVDALYALALRMREEPRQRWPHLLLMIGDQVYEDEDAPETRRFIRSRRDTSRPPHEAVADFEEYTRLYWESWRDPVIRWLFSTVSTAMIFDDHDVHDDWNTSQAWLDEIRRQPWWEERITSALMSYWIYQHIGNLPPSQLADSDLWRRVGKADDAGPLLREFAQEADSHGGGFTWSYWRDLGRVRLVVLDSREGRRLEPGRRSMFDEEEWRWIKEHAAVDAEHLLIADTLPVICAPGLHHAELWNEAVCDGVWGSLAARTGEKLRRAMDLEHWPAFRHSFDMLLSLVRDIAVGEHGRPPTTISLLAGDVHHAYLCEIGFPPGTGAASRVYQAVCSPLRNPLDSHERLAIRAAWSRPARALAHRLARAAGVPDAEVGYRCLDGPVFDNQIATLEFEAEQALIRVEKATADDRGERRLEKSFERQLS
jgi:hypothetical protein